MALAVGDFAFRAIGPRSGVYAEPSGRRRGGARVRRSRGDDRRRREALRPVPLGSLRHARAAAELSVRRHGESAPDVPDADGDHGRPLAGVADRARARALVVGQPGHELDLERLLAQRRLHDLRRASDHGGAARPGRLPSAAGTSTARTWSKTSRTHKDADTRLAHSFGRGAHPDDVPSDFAYDKGALFLRTLELAYGREHVRRVPARLVRSPRVPVDRHADVRRRAKAQLGSEGRSRGVALQAAACRAMPRRRRRRTSMRSSARADRRASPPRRAGRPSTGSCSCARCPRARRSRACRRSTRAIT